MSQKYIVFICIYHISKVCTVHTHVPLHQKVGRPVEKVVVEDTVFALEERRKAHLFVVISMVKEEVENMLLNDLYPRYI